MIARPSISRNAWNAAERGAFGNVANPFVDQVTKTVWTRFLEREAADEAVVDARCVHAINDEELVHEVVRKAPDGKTASALCYSRLARYDHPLERAVVKTYSVDCEGCEEAGDGRLEFPLTGYVVDQVGDAYCMVSFALELAGFAPGDERDVLDGYASRLADEAQLAVWCSQLEAVLEPLDSPRELCSNDSFSGTYPCHC